MENIIISASEAWDYFQEHRAELETEMHIIAENEEYGIEVSITEDKGYPRFIVNNDGVELFADCAITEADCEQTVRRIYFNYLTNRVFSVVGDPVKDEDEEASAEMVMEDRDWALSASVEDLIVTFLDNNESGIGKYDECTEEIVEDLKDRIGEYLYKQWGISIFRPMVIEYDDESEEYHEYPYPHLVESDEEF